MDKETKQVTTVMALTLGAILAVLVTDYLRNAAIASSLYYPTCEEVANLGG